jgi:hypothetical protein
VFLQFSHENTGTETQNFSPTSSIKELQCYELIRRHISNTIEEVSLNTHTHIKCRNDVNQAFVEESGFGRGLGRNEEKLNFFFFLVSSLLSIPIQGD